MLDAKAGTFGEGAERRDRKGSLERRFNDSGKRAEAEIDRGDSHVWSLAKLLDKDFD
jgi:hypothetical protein